MRVIFTEFFLCFRDCTKDFNLSQLAPRVMSWKFLFPFCQWKPAKLREVPNSGTRIWTPIWPTSECLLILLTCTTFLSGTQKGSLERVHLFSSWNLEGFRGCVRFLSKEGRGKRPRNDYWNGPHECLLPYNPNSTYWTPTRSQSWADTVSP